jgi:hypothetical protein
MIGSTTGATKWMRSVKRVGVVACAVGGVALFTTHCSSSAATPQAFVVATLGEGSNPTMPCAFPDATLVTIGTSDNNEDGGSTKNGMDGLVLSCTVSSSGSGFAVQASVQTSGSAFQIQGTFTAPGKGGVGGGGMATASFSNTDGSYSSPVMGCTVNFMQASGEALGMGIMSGAVWGNVICPTLTLANGESVCSGNAEFKFENCGQ